MNISIWIQTKADYLIDYLREDVVIDCIIKHKDGFQIQFQTPDYVSIVQRYAHIAGVISVFLRPSEAFIGQNK
jgi:hypothetical protein